MLNKEEIKNIIPQREPFLMIDEVEQYIPGESCTAYKNVSKDEYYFKGCLLYTSNSKYYF